MAKFNVKTGDTVLVISGKDAGKQGKVLKVSPKDNKVVVAGVNLVSKTHKARSAQDKSEIRKQEAAISVSNVMPVCPKCGKATRVHHAVVDGKKVRVCKCGASLDSAALKVEKKPAKTEAKVEETKVEEKPAKQVAKIESKKTSKSAQTKVKATKTATTKKATTAKSSQRGV